MLQDIEPHLFSNQFENKLPKDSDFVFIFKNNRMLLKNNGQSLEIPYFADFLKTDPDIKKEAICLFSIDGKSYFLAGRGEENGVEKRGEENEIEERGYEYTDLRRILDSGTEPFAFACSTASHLSKWYGAHRFCGRCGEKTEHKKEERAVVCPNCRQTEYPKISPVVIVGIKNGEELLMTKYTAAASEYRNYALVAGFVEIGETLENAVRREVAEEVGIRVKNITYYKSQPWALSESLLAGFFADLDGGKDVRLDEKELSEAVWISREEIPAGNSLMSLTGDMIEAFRSGKIK